MQRNLNGGTTISGTMLLAHLAGIKVFATGGLGGVHRGAENSMDISADLTELGHTPVAVISSGCKSFLDIPRTLEYLETQGVGVSTFADGREGRVDFPAFWTRDSGVPSPSVIEDERTAAAMIGKSRGAAFLTGILTQTLFSCTRFLIHLIRLALCKSGSISTLDSQDSDGCNHYSSYPRCREGWFDRE